MLGDAGAQAAVAAMGCTVTVIMSAEDFDKHSTTSLPPSAGRTTAAGPVG
jgi:hypothetical protein